MCGILAEMDGRYEDAETFFEGATCVNPRSVVAWTLFGEFRVVQGKFLDKIVHSQPCSVIIPRPGSVEKH